ncbi:MAG: MFS transporter [Pseudomonadota bacterium]
MPSNAYAGRLARNVSLTYGAIFTVYGLQLPFLGVFLESRGLSAEQIGIAVAVPALLRLVFNPAVAAWADATRQHGRMLVVLCAIGVVGAAGLSPASGLLLLTLAVTTLMLPLQSAMPFVEVIAMRGVRGHGLDYGRLRLWGSLTFIIATVGGGAAIEQFGPEVLPPLLLVAALLCVAASAALVLQDRGHDEDVNAGGAMTGVGQIGFLAQVRDVLAVPGLAVFLVGAAVVQASHAVYYAFSALHWSGQGVSGELIGLLWALGVVAEIGLFAVSGRVVAMVGATGLLAIGAGAGVVRWGMMALDPALIWLWPLQALHALTFGATHLAAIHFIAERVPTPRAGMAQSLFATFSTGVVMAAALYVAGLLYGAFSALGYLAMAGLAGVGVMAAIAGQRTPRRTSSAS